MKNLDQYLFEYLFLAIVFLLSVAGFWNIYFGTDSNPTPFHHLHVATNFVWLCLLLFQLSLIGSGKYGTHKKVGLFVFVFGPLLVATTALLSVHSAHKGLVSGRGDFLIVQNVMVTLELALVILLAFILRKRRKLHGALLFSTSILFMGIALFFTLISFVPGFKIEGPETFYRFGTAAMAGQAISLVVGILFFIRDFRNGWPLLVVSSFFLINEFIRLFLTKHDLIQPLTEFIGSLSKSFVFIGSFAILFALLAATGIQNARQRNAS